MSVQRLVNEFGAQDVGAWMTVFQGGQHTRVAKWVDGAGWVPTEEGALLLAGEEVAPVVEPAAEVFARHGKQRGKKAEKVADEIFGDDE